MRAPRARPLPRDDGSAFQRAAAFGVETLTDVMQYALERDYLGAAAASAEILGEIADPAIVVRNAGRPSPLVAARAGRAFFAATEDFPASSPSYTVPVSRSTTTTFMSPSSFPARCGRMKLPSSSNCMSAVNVRVLATASS